jgi:hypothetical protein
MIAVDTASLLLCELRTSGRATCDVYPWRLRLWSKPCPDGDNRHFHILCGVSATDLPAALAIDPLRAAEQIHLMLSALGCNAPEDSLSGHDEDSVFWTWTADRPATAEA